MWIAVRVDEIQGKLSNIHGENTESAKPLLNLLNLLTVENIFRLKLLYYSYKCHKKQLPDIFDQYFRYAIKIHSTYNTRSSSKGNFYKTRFRTNIGKQATKAMAVDVWQELPDELKSLNLYKFTQTAKRYLIKKQIT